jgi:type IV secretory pathway TrbD component
MGWRLALSYIFGALAVCAGFSAGVGIFEIQHLSTGLLVAIVSVAISIMLARAEGRLRRY